MWSRVKLAQATGYSLAHVSRILSGKRKPSVRCAQALARALDLPLEDFLAQLPTTPAS